MDVRRPDIKADRKPWILFRQTMSIKDRYLLSSALLGLALYARAAADDAPGADALPGADADHLALGPGSYVTSSYPGARSTRSVTIPFVDAEYAGRFYANAEDVAGVYAYKDASTEAGVAVAYDLTRRLARDDERFRLLRDINATPRFKLFASRTVSFLTGDANIATDMAGRGQGTLAQANAWATVPFTPRLVLSTGPGLTWADTDYMRTFFAVSSAQAAVSPLHAYAARAGVVDIHWNGIVGYQVSSRWSLGVSEEYGRLRGSAVASPVTLGRSQTTLLSWAAYKWK